MFGYLRISIRIRVLSVRVRVSNLSLSKNVFKRKGSSSLEPSTQLFVSCLQKACLVYLFHVLNTGNDNMVFLFLYVDQVVRVIVIQKTLIEHAEKLHQVKVVLEEVL